MAPHSPIDATPCDQQSAGMRAHNNRGRGRWAWGLAGAIWLVVAAVAPAGAHTALVAADPEPGSKLSAFDDVQLRFETPLIDDGRNRIWLQRSDGSADYELGPIVFVSDREVRAPLAEMPPPGEYLVRYLLVSDDADINEGSFVIDITTEPGATGTWVLLGVGVAALAVVGFLLRPKGGETPAPRR